MAMVTVEKIKDLQEEGERFLQKSHYEELDDLAKINANTYMRGLKEGMRIAEKSRKESVPV